MVSWLVELNFPSRMCIVIFCMQSKIFSCQNSLRGGGGVHAVLESKSGGKNSGKPLFSGAVSLLKDPVPVSYISLLWI